MLAVIAVLIQAMTVFYSTASKIVLADGMSGAT